MRITNQMLANKLKNMVSKTSNSQGLEKGVKVGTEFTAKVVNIFNNTLTLEIEPGKYLEALDTSAGNYSEGDVQEFVVTENKADGQVLIKALTQELLELIETKELETLIAKTKIPPTKENLEVVKELMINKIPITEDNLKAIIDGKNHFEKAGNLVENKKLQLTYNKIKEEVKSVLIEQIKSESQTKSEDVLTKSSINPSEGTKELLTKNRVKSNTITIKNTDENIETKAAEGDRSQNDNMGKNNIGPKLKEVTTGKNVQGKINNNELSSGETQKDEDSKNLEAKINDKALSKEAIKELVDIVKQLTPEKLVFLLKNKMDFSFNNLKQIENLLIGKEKLTEQIKELITELEKENPKSEELKSLKLAIKGLELREVSNKSKVDTGLKTLSDSLNKINQSESGKISVEGIRNQLGELKESVDFLNRLNDQMTFLQIPVQLNEQSKNIDIFIQRDNSGKRKINPKDTKVFISLDTNHLQLIQVLIEIKDTNINLNFRIENDKVENLLKSNDELLLPTMNTLGFNSVNIKYAVSDKKMDLTNMIALESVDAINKIDMKV